MERATAPPIQCSSCSAEIPATSLFCSFCGQAVISQSQAPTRAFSNVPPSPLRASRLISSDSIPAGGFAPGAILADRYRIIGLLGRGGMGEVYRADDLKLGQPVALKFLPKALALDPVRRERFFAEVRITRQLSHPNICRVYDIAEFEGQHFLSMEYIDGEDLASLIKRIGYLSNEKALEIARQFAAGLAAAHEKGVLHRDLKPANIMIDGHGRVRITDFGLAVATGDDTKEEADILGTPAYMAPEQFAGKGATTRSDIYALGLILYEIYSGKRAFTAGTIAELRAQKDGQTPTAPSDLRQGLDPVVERLILRCLDRDPRARPASVAQVALALPGGDPLAAAIAAGETPSPEMVAACGHKEGLRPAAALAILAFMIVGVVASIAMSSRTMLHRRVPFEKSPEILTQRSREFIKSMGYSASFADSASRFTANDDYLRYLMDSDKTASRWNNLSSDAILFWYRQSPRSLQPNWFNPSQRVWRSDPPMEFSGEVLVTTDTEGHLRSFSAIPPQVESAPGGAPPAIDWTLLFSEAGLDASKWMPSDPQWSPVFFADTRAAWQGSMKEWPGIPMRIEAAAYHGRPVSFEIIGPWTRAWRMELAGQRMSERIGNGIALAVFLTIMGVAAFFARRNLRLGRGDRRGAARLAVFSLCLCSASWILETHHVPTLGEFDLFMMFLGWALIFSALAWTLYIALEPFVRRRWPQILVSWTRLLSGDWRDPLVGRDVLAGCGFGVVLSSTVWLPYAVPTWFGYPEASGPALFDVSTITGAGPFAGSLVDFVWTAIAVALGYLCLFFFLRVLLRNDKIAGVALALVWAIRNWLFYSSWVVGIEVFLGGILIFFVLKRFGVVCLATTLFVERILGDESIPMTFQPSAWYSSYCFAALLVIAAICLFAFRTSLGGRPFLDPLRSEE